MERDDEPTRIDAAPRVSGPTLGSRYELKGLLGAGGMGSVFLAHDAELGELVAVKMLNDTGPSDLERFREEVRLARRVTHRNVARVYDIGEHAGQRFLTMEYVEGESLSENLRRTARLPVSELLRIADDICAGLAAAHEAGVIHRDLKPANIMLATSGRAVLTDFGIATRRHSADREIIGTPQYMAPEQYSGGEIDERTDIYALGGVLYRAAAGRRPFEGTSERSRAPNPCEIVPTVPSELGRLVEACLAMDAALRPPSALAVQRLLSAIVPTRDEERAPPTTRMATFAERNVRTLAVILRAEAPEEPRPGASQVESFEARLRDAIVERLAEHPVLRVTASPTPDAEATASLDVRRTATTVSVTIGLKGTREGLELWRGTVELPIERIVDLSNVAARRILEVLVLDMPPTREREPLPRALVETYLEARGLLRGLAPEHVQVAAALLEPVAAPSGHPLLLSALALARVQSSQYRSGDVARAREAVRDALARAPDEPETLRAEAALLWQDAEAVRPTRLLLRALDLAPGSTDIRIALARILLEAGVVRDAMRLAESVTVRVPSHGIAWVELARAHARLGRFDLAASALDRAGGATVGLALFERMRHAAWRRRSEDMAAIELRAGSVAKEMFVKGPLPFFAEVGVRHVPPRALEARIRASVPPGLSKRRHVLNAQLLAELAGLAGDAAMALDSLSEAVDHGLQDTVWLDRCPLFDDLLGDRRFEALRDVLRERARAVRDVLAET